MEERVVVFSQSEGRFFHKLPRSGVHPWQPAQIAQASDFSTLGWRPSLVGWRPLLGALWRPSLLLRSLYSLHRY